MSSKSSSNGFTLLEVVVAVVILSTSFTALVSLQSQSIYSFQKIRGRLAALSLAEDRLQRVLLEARGIDPGEMTNPELDLAYAGQLEVEDTRVEPNEAEIPPGLIYPVGWTVTKIIVTVSWDDGGENRNYVLQRLAMVPVEFQE